MTAKKKKDKEDEKGINTSRPDLPTLAAEQRKLDEEIAKSRK